MLMYSFAGALDNNVEVPPKLQELHDSVCNIIVEYTIFLEVLASFLKRIKEVRFLTYYILKTQFTWKTMMRNWICENYQHEMS